jgi:hypothetical protein
MNYQDCTIYETTEYSDGVLSPNYTLFASHPLHFEDIASIGGVFTFKTIEEAKAFADNLLSI